MESLGRAGNSLIALTAGAASIGALVGGMYSVSAADTNTAVLSTVGSYGGLGYGGLGYGGFGGGFGGLGYDGIGYGGVGAYPSLYSTNYVTSALGYTLLAASAVGLLTSGIFGYRAFAGHKAKTGATPTRPAEPAPHAQPPHQGYAFYPPFAGGYPGQPAAYTQPPQSQPDAPHAPAHDEPDHQAMHDLEMPRI